MKSLPQRWTLEYKSADLIYLLFMAITTLVTNVSFILFYPGHGQSIIEHSIQLIISQLCA